MDAFLQLSPTERRLAFEQVKAMTGLQAMSVEKDFWVCWTLRELFALPGLGEHLTFKGGTSLSKAWKVVHRFSEDIDLVVDKGVLGMGDIHAPEAAPSKKQRSIRLKKLMAACQAWVQGPLRDAFTERLRATLGASDWQVEVDPDMADGQCLLLHYPSVFSADTAGYVRPVVKIELGGRSDDWPQVEKTIQPYVLEYFPTLDSAPAFPVKVLTVERTFWEKACLLHEETFRPTGKPRGLRMARHYYDLWCLLSTGVGEAALVDMALFRRVVEHRSIFFAISWVDYTTHKPGTFRLVPPASHLVDWRRDYEAMVGPMFFNEAPPFEAPPFEALMDAAAAFERKFNTMV